MSALRDQTLSASVGWRLQGCLATLQAQSQTKPEDDARKSHAADISGYCPQHTRNVGDRRGQGGYSTHDIAVSWEASYAR
jgi:hypothetical protein